MYFRIQLVEPDLFSPGNKNTPQKEKGYWLVKSYFFPKDSVQGRTFYTYVMDCKKSMHPRFWCHKVFSVIHKLPDCSISWIEEMLKDLSDSLICASEKLQVSSFDLLTYEWLHSSVCNRHHRGHNNDHAKHFQVNIWDNHWIVQQLWGSFLQFFSQPHFTNISFM